ncbi:uncharacterized protein LOC114530392 [Dendronephthya gigantea]|uniref:uncharacterized protein LOC114530392 n=1 Tax=Dendronephthya gigantea TaxID=151771 RepID=UPI00106C7F82|nr:uncharacterized protein LOC114530392 [Dendronephthya gigantea]
MLSMRSNPTSAVLYTLSGPVRCVKVTLDCRDCSIHYGICKYCENDGARFYPANDGSIDLIEVSNVTYIQLDLYKWVPSLSNHCWVSFSGFAEAYNEIYQQEIRSYNWSKQDKSADKDENVCTEDDKGILPGEMSAKVVAKSFWSRETELELASLGLRGQWYFKEEKDGDNTGTLDDIMDMVDKKRCAELYSHNCSNNCKIKGCGQLYVADGN